MKARAAFVSIALMAIALVGALAPAPGACQNLVSKRKTSADIEKTSSVEESSPEEAQAKVLMPSERLPILERTVDPDSYVLGPYDQLVMSIMGPEPVSYVLGVLPEGDVLVPGMGPVKADGLTLTEFRRALEEMVERYYRNIELYCYLQTPATFRVFVTGEVLTPGVAAVSGVERVVDALDAAGGVKGSGSLRSITLERGGRSIRVDLLRFLSQGDLTNNPFLRSGDRIHVPPRGWHAMISGRVHLPGTFEIIEGETIDDLIALAGGFAEEAVVDSVLLKRIGENGAATTGNVTKDGFGTPLRDGDEVAVYDDLKARRYVIVDGAVNRTGQFELGRGEKLSSLIVRAGGFREMADLSAAYIEKPGGAVVKIDLEQYRSPEPSKDLVLEDGDALTVPFIPSKVSVGGEVNEPGEFAYRSDLTVVQYIGLAGGPTKDGSVDRVVVYSADGGTRGAGRDAHLNRGDVIIVKRSTYRLLADFFRGTIQLGTFVVSIIILSNQ
jgi:protein involved in polysaccharide export with SLBB domain